MKRSPLKRRELSGRRVGGKAPERLDRRVGLKRRPPKPRRDADPERLAWVREQVCCRCGGLQFRTEAHHPTGAGLALKAPDADAIPVCSLCHRQLHDLVGLFDGWSKLQLRRWQAGQVLVYQVLYERHRSQCDASEGAETF